MTVMAVISFFVRVPVLSEQITLTQPSVSTVGSFLTIDFRLAILITPSANVTVTTMGSPSGIAATAKLKEDNQLFSPRGISFLLLHLLPHADREHFQCIPSLDQADETDNNDDAQGVNGQLFPEMVHTFLQRSFGRLKTNEVTDIISPEIS